MIVIIRLPGFSNVSHPNKSLSNIYLFLYLIATKYKPFYKSHIHIYFILYVLFLLTPESREI